MTDGCHDAVSLQRHGLRRVDESESFSTGKRSKFHPDADHELEREANHGAHPQRISREADDGVTSLCMEQARWQAYGIETGASVALTSVVANGSRGSKSERRRADGTEMTFEIA